MGGVTIKDLGANVGYTETLALQEQLHARRVAGEVGDTLLLLEHKPIYTLGRSAVASNILDSEEALREAGIERTVTTRGGDVTYHGPGQLVGYPIIHLGEAGLSVLTYLGTLEEVLIQTVAAFGINAGRDVRNRGVWVGDNKLAALGIRVSRQVTMHGFALNVTTDLSAYRGIVPCGLRHVGVTSMACLLGQTVNMVEVKTRVGEAFGKVSSSWGC